MENSNLITIVLDNSLYAHAFDANNQIHKTYFDKAFKIIEERLDRIKKKDKGEKDNSIYLDHIYQTISVFGDRGSGKTSFLISLLKECKESSRMNVEVLPIIDPTLVEHKKPIILCIISMINQLVEEVLRKQDLNPDGASFELRKFWREIMRNISTGVVAVENVGGNYDNQLWRDEDYVLYTGLGKVEKTNDFELNFREMIRKALEILGKDAFIIAFDDIDVDAKQGWNVLEALRRYLSDEHIISIVSGDLKLYSMLVRKNLSENLFVEDAAMKKRMTNELENQYMIKLLNPTNRINLRSIHNLLQLDNLKIEVEKPNGEKVDLKETYQNILEKFKIKDTSIKNMYMDFFTNISLRSQIQFLRTACDREFEDVSLDIFVSRLLAAGIDLDVLTLNGQIANITILKYLRKEGYLKDDYLLLPALSDKDSNSNLTAFSMVTCQHFARHPYTIFDYMLRIGYLRNVMQSEVEATTVEDLCKYAGWNQLMSLKNNVGLTMAYEEGKGLGNLNEHIALFGLNLKSKKIDKTKELEVAFDKALRDSQYPKANLLAMFPFVRTISNRKNESRCYYSIFALLAAIGEVLKCEDEKDMVTSLDDLKFFRGYQMPQDTKSSVDESEIEKTTFGINIDSEYINNLATAMFKWKESYSKDVFLPPYAIGRIMTRLYASVSNIEKTDVGEKMNLSVANFFNSCLIEEAKIDLDNIEQSTINNNNLKTDTNILKNNLDKLGKLADGVNKLKFTRWIMACPMLNCFIDENIYDKIKETESIEDKRPEVFEMLSKIDSKKKNEGDGKPSFYGSFPKGVGTLRLLLTKMNGRDIIDNIINKDVDSAVESIKETNLFGKVYADSVRAFQKNFQRIVDGLKRKA